MIPFYTPWKLSEMGTLARNEWRESMSIIHPEIIKINVFQMK